MILMIMKAAALIIISRLVFRFLMQPSSLHRMTSTKMAAQAVIGIKKSAQKAEILDLIQHPPSGTVDSLVMSMRSLTMSGFHAWERAPVEEVACPTIHPAPHRAPTTFFIHRTQPTQMISQCNVRPPSSNNVRSGHCSATAARHC